MDDHDRISQASSVATISYFPVIKESDGKVQTFGKRCQAAKRDPNCPVVIRGWLNKKDSSGLKLWKRRWFVLSNYCLYYYKDSREESVLGSIPLPSYKILFCTPRECKNRKFTFKVVHQGMRSYFFSADTQEDMLGWVRALSQSASMETDGSLNRRCSSYQDFTKLGGSSESVDLAKPTSDGECTPLKHRHISRTLSEPSQLTGGRMGTMHPEHRGRRGVRQRRSRTPSPADFNRRAVCRPEQEEDSLPGGNTSQMQAEMMGMGCLTPRGHLGSRPHTPVGRVDIRPHDDSVMVPQTPYYTPASPKLEFKFSPTTPERWQDPNKPSLTYGSVHHVSSGRRPLGKSYSAGAHADLLPPLPPPSRASHAPPPLHQHHHHRSNFSVCVLPPAMAPKPDLRETPPIRPLESDADAVLTRLCGCDKLLQSLSVQLAQLQMDKDGVHCALDVSRLQLEKWKNQESRAQEEALTQKALLQEELVTIRARMCDVSMEMELVWNQYERMESELSVIHSHLQHICNFGLPQEQCQAQRELWMMEDILAGLKINRDHFCFLLGLQRRHMFQQTAPHAGSPGSPTDRLHSGLPMDEDQEPPVRPPLPQELLESHQGTDRVWTQSPYEGIYSHTVDHRRGNSQPDLLNVKAQKDNLDSQSGSKWIPPHATSQSTKKIKMSEEEQIERMKRNQERLINRKKHSVSTLSAQRQSQGAETTVEAPFPLRVTRVVTAVLPSSLMARRVAVEDPPPELSNPLPEQIQPEVQQRSVAQNKKTFNRSPRCLLLESPDRTRSSADMHQDEARIKTDGQQRDQAATGASMETQAEAGRGSRDQTEDHKTVANESVSMDTVAEEQTPALLAPDRDADLGLTPEQREAKLRRVERIRERVIRSAVQSRERASTNDQQPSKEEGKDADQVPPDVLGKHRLKADHESFHGSCGDNVRGAAELQLSGGTSQEEDEKQRKQKNQLRFGMKTQHKAHSGRTAVAKAKIKRPGSPYHLSCMTVYQKDGGKGSVHCKDEDEQNLEDPVTGDNENNHSSSSARAKWFLSTNQWQGFVPLQIPSIDSAPNEEISDTRKLTDDVPDSNEMSSAVSQSLEKMKENHLLFYKIACDISISDTDITKNDGNSNGRGSPRPEEEEESVITEPGREATHVLKTSSNQENNNSSPHLPFIVENNASINNSLQDSTGEMSPATEVCVDEKTHQNIHEDTLRQEDKDPENIHGAPGQDIDCDVDGNAKTRYVDAKEDGKSEQKRSKEMKKCSSLSEENKERVQKQECSITASGSVCEGRSVMRSASFGKARVTVLRTSL